jgi:hypothetical protein
MTVEYTATTGRKLSVCYVTYGIAHLKYLDGVRRRALDGKRRGLTWRLKETLEDMEYADDICLVSHKYEHMQKKLDDLREESKKVGLQINPLKKEYIRVNTIINRVLKLNSEEIKNH